MVVASAMANLGTYIETFVRSEMMPLGVTVGGAAVVVAGFAFYGTKEMKAWAKSHVLSCLFGAVIVYMGLEFMQSWVSNFYF